MKKNIFSKEELFYIECFKDACMSYEFVMPIKEHNVNLISFRKKRSSFILTFNLSNKDISLSFDNKKENLKDISFYENKLEQINRCYTNHVIIKRGNLNGGNL